ncbi:hypothetical protein SAMD00079811_10480 [Scytonema sp. HK-05]|uniref:NACHT domain-containing protein n=1 Tax=Scytonema sp. HK-05 TaxID=1137095 RepID=UPI0009366B33|nr:HEAT repeat domain-containing protein [Scytonema sp. HK-05]OKH58787.1 hypothetical protein NIES2130_13010 [Scytonema sp. HK-05]BAY43468.1 hypothetical protein SAMD00079811_10480 [Scytonema sp. HK-05]
MAATPNPEFQAYLEAIATEPKYQYWSNNYTSTDTVGKQPLNDIGLMVQTVPLKQQQGMSSEEKEEIERLNVLEAIRKYAVKHVLLVGKPGSGKSTALERLLWEEATKPLPPTPLSEAERGEEDSPPSLVGKGAGGLGQIPVLVRLREYKTSVLDIIRDFLATHDPSLEELEETDIKRLLLKGQFLLLVDGLNELPDEQAREELKKFRQKYKRCTPMIFTTRDLSLGRDFHFTKQLEMQPLTETQMQAFVRAYLGQQGEQMLPQLNDRQRKFAETPLLLWMLCRVYAQEGGKIPTNLGAAFQDFASLYDNQLKRGVPAFENYRHWCSELLQQLAFNMMQGAAPAELRLNISKGEAEDILTQYLEREKFDKPRDYAKRWLEDLLEHHLIQVQSNNQIEFRHQLLQEYYAAEYLLKQLHCLSDAKLKRDYLNYLKWTEPLALMLALEEKEAQAMRVVKLALDVDLMLAARLAGEVKPEFQEKTVGLILGLNVPQTLKIELLGITRSEYANAFSSNILHYEYSDARGSADYALEKIGNQQAVDALILALQDKNLSVRSSAIDALAKIGNRQAVDALILALQNEYSDVRSSAIDALAKIGNRQAVDALILALQNEYSDVRSSAAIALVKISTQHMENALILVSQHQSSVRLSTAIALGKIGNQQAENALFLALQNQVSSIRLSLTDLFAQIGNVDALILRLQDEYLSVRLSAASALGNIADSEILSRLWELRLNGIEETRNTILKIQEGCKFYNHEIFNSPPVVEGKTLPGSAVINSEIVQIIEKNDGTVIAKKI